MLLIILSLVEHPAAQEPPPFPVVFLAGERLGRAAESLWSALVDAPASILRLLDCCACRPRRGIRKMTTR